MTYALALLIMASPFLVAAALSAAAHRSGILTVHLDQFRSYAPLAGRLADYDAYRAEHDLDAVRAHSESGERR